MATATGNFIPNFHFAQGNLYYSTSAVTYAAAAISANAVITTANQVIQAKNLTFTPPKGEVEVVNLLGAETTTMGAGIPSTGSFQNQIFDEKSWTEGILTGTLILTGHGDGASATVNLPDFINLATGTVQAISTTYHRHTFGDNTASQVRVTAGAVILIMKNAVEEVTLCLNTPYVNLGDIKPTGDDGYYEVDVEIKALAKNVVIEIKDFD